ncbi:hypothetical protein Acor_13980 [Acrocarpospora corrugata]|uniref:CHAT domain-containing protein n=1 Tax=Acrocarpospora corrugata TaxID=35763 RepID=A0A5M3VRC0_9ACTN|nr:CHAT domain-containing protein [Acrocarpospora corrugata]GER99334.1 hypothetical protein Acor_13980 [Acrocarpospora corrugata]
MIDNDLPELVRRFLQADSPQENMRLIDRHPRLLTSAAIEEIDRIIPLARQHNEGVAKHFEMLRRLLQRCEEVGVQVAFAEFEAADDPLLALALEFINADTWTDCRAILEADPRLVDFLLGPMEVNLAANIAQGLISMAEMHVVTLHLLRRCQEIGVGPALTELIEAQGHPERTFTPTSDFADDVFAALVKLELSDEARVTADSVAEVIRFALVVADFVASPDRPTAEGLIRANPELRTPRTITLLGHLAETADEAIAILLRKCQWFLERFNPEDDQRRPTPVRTEHLPDPKPDIPAEFASDFHAAMETDREARTPDETWAVIDVAIAKWTALIDRPDFVEANSSFRWLVHNQAAIAHARKDQLTDDLANLDGLIRCWTEVVQLGFGVYSGMDGYLVNLATACLKRYEIGDADVADLEQAIALFLRLEEAERLTEPDWLAGFAGALNRRGERLRALADPTAAIEHASRAIAIAEERDVAVEPWFHGNLSTSHWQVFELTGDPTHLDAAVRQGRLAVAAAPPGHPKRFQYQAALANALGTRYERYGQLSDVDEAIDAGREALDAYTKAMPGRWTNMSVADNPQVFREIGIATDLGQVFPPLPGRSELHHVLPGLLSNLATDLSARFRDTENTADIEEAITRLRAAVAATPPDHADRPKCLNSLSAAHLARYRHSVRTDLDEAVRIGSLALEATRPGHPWRGVTLSTLKHALVDRFELSGDPADRKNAIDMARLALEATPDGPDRAFSLMHLGDALDRSDRVRPERQLWQSPLEARQRWEEVLTIPNAAPKARALASRVLGHQLLIAGKAVPALAHFARAIGLLPALAWKGLDREAQESQLTTWAGLAGEAASCALSAEQPERAIELLEHGRSVLWAQTLEVRTELTELGTSDDPRAAELAGRIHRLRVDFENGDGLGNNSGSAGSDWRIAWAREWDAAMAEARALVRSRTAAELAATADDEAIIVVNISQHRCDGILLHGGQVTPLPLTVTLEEIGRRVGQHLRMVWEYESGAIDGVAFQRELSPLLEWLWEAITGPCLAALGITGAGRSRVWWCPTGALVGLPLHAAGYHDTSGRSVLDRTISSYTSTVGALSRAKSGGLAKGDRRLLTVGVPLSPQTPPLRFAQHEVNTVIRRVGREHTDLLYGEVATRDDVAAALKDHAWAHFACHGSQDPHRPARGALHLADGPLTVVDIADLKLQHAELAYLSACQSAVGGVRLPDESIHLAGALQLAGYRHVIATLWSIQETHAVEMADHTYRNLARGSAGLDVTRAAEAVRDATTAIRADHPHSPGVWVPYVHFGP